MSIIDTITAPFKRTEEKTPPKNATQRKGIRANHTTGTSERSKWIDDVYNDSKYKKNLTYNDYKKMEKEDAQIKIGLSVIQAFLLSRNWTITSNSDSEEDKAIADFVRDAIDNLDTDFRDTRKNLYTAIKYGFSVQEEIYEINEEGLIVLKDLFPLHIKTLQNEPFKYDKKGEVTHVHQKSEYGEVEIEIDKCLRYSFDSEFGEIEGESILDSIYINYFVKKKILEWLAIYLEKHESPTIAAFLQDATKADIVTDNLDDIAEGTTNITMGKEDDLKILESSHRGEGFFKAIEYHDNTIFRRFFIGTLLFGQANAGGAYSQSQTHIEMTKMIFEGLHIEMASKIQKTINKFVGWNFVDANSPNFTFQSFEDKDIIQLLQALQPYVANLTIDPESDWFNELIANVVEKLSDVKVDLNNMKPSDDPEETADVNKYSDPIPGTEEIIVEGK